VRGQSWATCLPLKSLIATRVASYNTEWAKIGHLVASVAKLQTRLEPCIRHDAALCKDERYEFWTSSDLRSDRHLLALAFVKGERDQIGTTCSKIRSPVSVAFSKCERLVAKFAQPKDNFSTHPYQVWVTNRNLSSPQLSGYNISEIERTKFEHPEVNCESPLSAKAATCICEIEGVSRIFRKQHLSTLSIHTLSNVKRDRIRQTTQTNRCMSPMVVERTEWKTGGRRLPQCERIGVC
jgi:hypothetical protein